MSLDDDDDSGAWMRDTVMHDVMIVLNPFMSKNPRNKTRGKEGSPNLAKKNLWHPGRTRSIIFPI
jgi:hypothetical protein